MRDGMLRRVLLRSLRNRAGRVVVAGLAVLLGGSLVAALGSLSLDVGSKAGRELRAYGANVVLAPRAVTAQTGVGGLEFGAVQEERYLAEADLAALADGARAGEVLGSAPYLYGLAETAGGGASRTRVAVAGVRFDRVRELSPWWQVDGAWAAGDAAAGGPADPAEAMVGQQAAARLGLRPGDALTVRAGGRELALRVVGVVETGAAEDAQLFAPLAAVQRLLGREGLVSLVQVSVAAEGRPLAAVAADLESRVPGARARVVGQIAEAEAAVLGKVRLLVGLVAALVLLTAGLAVGSTMAASVLERTREIGLLKALGAADGRIALLFLAEATTIALGGGLVGFVLGLGLAAAIGQVVFGTPIAPSLLPLPLTLGVALVVCLLASALPIRRALAVDPATTLRGD